MFITHLRPARPSDCVAIFQAHYYAVRLACLQSYDAIIRHEWLALLNENSYLRDMNQPNIALWVAEYHGAVMGFFQLDLLRAHLSAVYVHPAVHKQGIGTALLQRAEQLTLDSGASALSLYCPNNALAFFRLNGYQTLSEAFLPLNQDVKVPCRLMRKYLDK
ncbi:N-acetylglutamate synthase, GNAT family [Alysiella filiformis DSM 16848]|uniref:N-acetylglutamate synthase, GNAT family n=1 Tax=Alysiella filiformis DSM 16848 TaxID=1120981 RepID=A0A286EBK4_9NEIS|nr:N-acetylglutamate synthase, GNAT family [Alysiella filiformis DSM 16848]